MASLLLGYYAWLCRASGQRVDPQDAWRSIASLGRAAWGRDDPSCARQLERLNVALRLPPREDLVEAEGVVHNVALPPMTAEVTASESGKHYVTLARDSELTEADVSALAALGWERAGTARGIHVFERPGWMLQVDLARDGGRCLTDVYAAIDRSDAAPAARRR
jgi:hypothetical protein